jgi:hypothetical protein
MAGTTTYFGISYPQSTDLVKDGAANMQTIATGFDSAVAIPTYNAQTGTTYTFALTDIGKTVTASNASASTYTIPPTASVTWPTNTTLTVINLGAGVVTFAGGVGVTVNNTAATLAQNVSAQLIRTGLNVWTVVPFGSPSALTLVKSQTVGTAVSSVTVTGAFSSAYDNYLITLNNGSSSGTIDMYMTVGATTSGYYWNIIGNSWNPTANNNGSTSGSSWSYIGATDATNGTTLNVRMLSPFLNKRTIVDTEYVFTGGGYKMTGMLNNTTSYTSFTLAPNSGTLTGGTIRVYGYANS